MSEEKSPKVANDLTDGGEQCLPLPDESERETSKEQVAENATRFISDQNCAIGHSEEKLDSPKLCERTTMSEVNATMSEEKSPKVANDLTDGGEQCLPLPDESARETPKEQVAENATRFISDQNCAIGHSEEKLDSPKLCERTTMSEVNVTMSEEKSPKVANDLTDGEQCLPLPDESERETSKEQVAENATRLISDQNCAIGHSEEKLDSPKLCERKNFLSPLRLIRTPFKSQSQLSENKKTVTIAPPFTSASWCPSLEVSPLYLRLPQRASGDSKEEAGTSSKLPDFIFEHSNPDSSRVIRALLYIRIPEIKKMLQNVSDLKNLVDERHVSVLKVVGDPNPFAPYESKTSEITFEIQPTPESVLERNEKLLESWSYLRKCVGHLKEQVEKLLSWCEQTTPESNMNSLSDFTSGVDEMISTLPNLVLLYMKFDKAYNFSGRSFGFLVLTKLNNLISVECFNFLSEVNSLKYHLQHIIVKNEMEVFQK